MLNKSVKSQLQVQGIELENDAPVATGDFKVLLIEDGSRGASGDSDYNAVKAVLGDLKWAYDTLDVNTTEITAAALAGYSAIVVPYSGTTIVDNKLSLAETAVMATLPCALTDYRSNVHSRPAFGHSHSNGAAAVDARCDLTMTDDSQIRGAMYSYTVDKDAKIYATLGSAIPLWRYGLVAVCCAANIGRHWTLREIAKMTRAPYIPYLHGWDIDDVSGADKDDAEGNTIAVAAETFTLIAQLLEQECVDAVLAIQTSLMPQGVATAIQAEANFTPGMHQHDLIETFNKDLATVTTQWATDMGELAALGFTVGNDNGGYFIPPAHLSSADLITFLESVGCGVMAKDDGGDLVALVGTSTLALERGTMNMMVDDTTIAQWLVTMGELTYPNASEAEAAAYTLGQQIGGARTIRRVYTHELNYQAGLASPGYKMLKRWLQTYRNYVLTHLTDAVTLATFEYDRANITADFEITGRHTRKATLTNAVARIVSTPVAVWGPAVASVGGVYQTPTYSWGQTIFWVSVPSEGTAQLDITLLPGNRVTAGLDLQIRQPGGGLILTSPDGAITRKVVLSPDGSLRAIPAV